MEDNLENAKQNIQNVDHLSNHWSDFLKIWNLALGDQAKCYGNL